MEQATAQDRLLGAKVGNYEVKHKLGEGGMGAVYLAVHPNIGKRVALKVLHPEFSSNEDVIGRFFNEAKAVNDIQHPNIVDIIDYGEMPSPGGGQKVVYFIMEFLPGDSLAKLIHDQAPLAPERAQMIALQIADALAASHRHGIVHRDLKPDNVMITIRRDGRDFVKVLDFGIAKLTGDHPGSRRTRTGIVMGTPAYMSPEQCEGRGQVDQRTDIYALGILLYEMLTGQVPFRGEGYGEVLVQHMTQVPRKPSTIRGVIPPHLEAVCMKALEKRPADRFADMDQLMRALQDPVAYVESHGGIEGFLSYGRGYPDQQHPPYFPGPGSGVGPGYGQPNLGPTVSPLTPYPSMPADGRMTTPMGGQVGLGQVGLGMLTPPPPGARSDAPSYPTPPPGRLAAPGVGGGKIALIALGAVALGVVAFFGYRAIAGGPRHARAPVVTPVKTPPQTPVQKADPDGQGALVPQRDPPVPATVNIAVGSNPSGAKVYVGAETEPRGTTPFTLTVDRATAPIELLLKANGYADKRETVVPSENRVLELVLVAEAKPEIADQGDKGDQGEKGDKSSEGDKADKGDKSSDKADKSDGESGDKKGRDRDRDRRREHRRDRGKEDGPSKVGDDVIRPEL